MSAAPVRVIARLDVKGPNLIKGIQFDGHRVLGSPEFFADQYYREGADELFFQDTVASLYGRNQMLSIIENTARRVFIPITVAGGIRSVDDVRQVLRAGADKVAINTAAIENPKLISEAARVFGSQCVVSSIEAYKRRDGSYRVWVDYGRQVTDVDAIDWAKRVVDLGAGEIMLTSINQEGTGRGYDLELTQRIAEMVSVPVVACGGAGSSRDLVDVVQKGKADAVAAASIFHYHYCSSEHARKHKESQSVLRMGKHIDVGNWDFLEIGYCGQKELNVKPSSFQDVRSEFKRAGLETRHV